MKIKKFSLILFLTLIIIVLFQGCKNETPVEQNNNNNQGTTSPVLLIPANNSTVNNLNPRLDWEDFPQASSYNVQVSLDANINGIIVIDTSGLSASELIIPSGRLTTGVNYYWRVRPSSGGNYSAWSAIWRFNVIFNAPAPPVLLSPPDNSASQSFLPLFDWEDDPTADFYRLQVSGSTNFSSILLDTGHIIVSQLQCPQMLLNTGTQYFWRVNASNSNGVSTSQWSTVFNFTTLTGPEPYSISGTVTFADTNFVGLPAYYTATLYVNWPPGQIPLSSDSLEVIHSGNKYHADYLFRRVPNNQYYIAVSINTLSGTILGIYGCDTNHVQFSGCPNSPPPVNMNNNGLEHLNFISWADTSKKIF